jgi:tetratricopeptide (TPR) repeat protein
LFASSFIPALAALIKETRVMRGYFAVAVLMFTGLFAGVSGARAQSALLNLPDASQHARVTQRIGITDITIDYHRPLVRGRKIFGGLQAYGQVWRAGANYNTTVEFSDPVTVEGRPLPKGVYGLHLIPGENSWVVIFSKNSTSWGSFTYDPAEDALRVTVKPQAIANHEALSYDFDDPKPNSALITMRWERVAVPFKVEVNTPEITRQSLRNQLRARVQFEWQAWQEAADYLLNNQLGAEEALKYAERSVEIEDRFENEMTRSHALSALGRNEEALAARDKAIAKGDQLQVHSYGRGLQIQGRQDEALELFRINIKKDPNSWVGHNDAARVAVAKGDFDTAVREMRLAVAAAPESLKAQHADLVRRLENREDINK